MRRWLERHEFEGPIAIQLTVFFFIFIFLLAAAVVGNGGCTASQRAAIRGGVITVGDCALHTALACGSQSLGGCNEERTTEDYDALGQCLVAQSAACMGRGLATCLFAGVVAVVGTSHVVAGGVGCTGEEDLELVGQCVRDVDRLESETEAVGAVASCYLAVCLGS